METLLTVLPYVLGATIFLSIFFKPEKDKKPVKDKPTQEEFDKVMKMLMIHGVISNSEYTKMYNSGRAFTKKK